MSDQDRQTLDALAVRLDRAPRAAVAGLVRRFKGLARRLENDLPIDRGLARLATELDQIESRAMRAEALLSRLEVPAELPIAEHAEAITAAIASHQVVIVAGETGSGKTTQLPKLCVAAGRGREGLIGMTQPRRIAARAIAQRLGEELGHEVGGLIGYEVRFDKKTNADTLIKVMTDGIALAETQGDPTFSRYDTLIIDEAHERSLNIDFLLGYLRQLLPQRPDLKVVITSATIDTERFSAHFGDAPVVEVSGRSYPVEVRYRPLLDDDAESNDWLAAMGAAIDELNRVDPMGDILVFLPGERDIRDAEKRLTRKALRHTEILPLLARLPTAQQQAIFHPGSKRRVILATNIAETSLTVPRIRFVIDSGLARISRYSHRSKVQRLPIEPVSQASANQRSGRCGRLGPGITIRLYGEDDYLGRPEYTEPEIVRTNLATVILTMERLKLGAVEDFPFLDPPDSRLIQDGYQLLEEVGALADGRTLTALGRRLADWPLDVRFARLMEGGREQNIVGHAATLAAYLSIADPRERPLDQTQNADTAHEQWRDARSDFIAVLKLWADFQAQRNALSGSQFRKWCRASFLSYPRLREWSDLRRQLLSEAASRKWSPGNESIADEHYAAIHRAICAAFLGQAGELGEDGYLGTRQKQFHIFPGSYLFGSRPKWLVCAFIMETQRVYARMCAKVEPGWLEQAAGHVVKRRYFEPFWSAKMGRVMGFEQVTLFGLTLVARRRVHYAPHDPKGARELFLLDGLVRDQLRFAAPFRRHNARLIADIEELEEKRRKRDLLVDEGNRLRFFASRVPEAIVEVKAFNRWRKKAESEQPKLLFFRPEDLLAETDHGATQELFPDQIEVDGVEYPLSYHLEPGKERDGVTIRVPLHRLGSLRPERLEWLVPGYLRTKVIALMKTLPKSKRRALVPVPDFADQFLATAQPGDYSLLAEMADGLAQLSDQALDPTDFDPQRLEPDLLMRIAVYDGDALLDAGRDLKELKDRYGEKARKEFLSQAGAEYFADGLTAWTMDALPVSITLDDGAAAYPALVDLGQQAGVRLFEKEPIAARQHQLGLRQLLAHAIKDKMRYVERQSGIDEAMGLTYNAIDTLPALRADFAWAVSFHVIRHYDRPVRDRESFIALVDHARPELTRVAAAMLPALREALSLHFQLRRQIDDPDFAAQFGVAFEDLSTQLEYLVYPGFLTEVSLDRLQHYPRYLTAVQRRMERLEHDPRKDRQKHERIRGFWHDYLSACDAFADYPAVLDRFHWLIEEYRVSLFAQELGTADKVSSKRLSGAWKAVQDELAARDSS